MPKKYSLLYKNRIIIFLNKHKNRICKLYKNYVSIRGKKYEIEIYYSGYVRIRSSKKSFRFDEKKIEEEYL